jgi:tetratricopeptide (TPR) repeat protein
MRGLETRHPGFGERLRREPESAVRSTRHPDVALLYWAGISWAAAIASAKHDAALVSELPQVEALLERAILLEEEFERGALHTFFIHYEMTRAKPIEERLAQATHHFQRALELSGRTDAGPYLSMAEGVAVELQDFDQFQELLRQALAIDADAVRELRLSNLIMQQRARWLLNRAETLFLVLPGNHPETGDTP